MLDLAWAGFVKDMQSGGIAEEVPKLPLVRMGFGGKVSEADGAVERNGFSDLIVADVLIDSGIMVLRVVCISLEIA